MSLCQACHGQGILVFMLASDLAQSTWQARFIATLTLFSHGEGFIYVGKFQTVANSDRTMKRPARFIIDKSPCC